MSGDDDLLDLARDAASRAHSPYSGLRVGAALRAADGRAFPGCNVENASFGLTTCAERAAVCAAVSAGSRAFERLAIWSSADHALMPCGACRQVLAEFGLSLGIVSQGARGERVTTSLAELLPLPMGPRDFARR